MALERSASNIGLSTLSAADEAMRAAPPAGRLLRGEMSLREGGEGKSTARRISWVADIASTSSRAACARSWDSSALRALPSIDFRCRLALRMPPRGVEAEALLRGDAEAARGEWRIGACRPPGLAL